MERLLMLAIVLMAAGLGGAAGCGGEERLSREELGSRLQSIGQQGSERWGRVAQGAADLEPDQPLPLTSSNQSESWSNSSGRPPPSSRS